MKRVIYVFGGIIILIITLGYSVNRVLANIQNQFQNPQDLVPLNGKAYWATSPTGPDFEGVKLIPFQAQNPSREKWDATHKQILSYLNNDFYS